MEHKTLSIKDLDIPFAEIYEHMGYGSASEGDNSLNVDDGMKQEVTGMLQEIGLFLRPEYAYVIVDGVLDQTDNTLTVGETTFHLGKIISHQLRGSQRYCFFVCTAGTAFQEFQDRLKTEGDMLREFIANAIGNVLAEKVADVMEAELGRSILPLHHTNRFSPGYCEWQVPEQQQLFSLFEQKQPCGVTLTDTSLMIPLKSVSGLIGIGENVKKLEYTCGLCNYSQCYKKRKQ